ncbi:Cap [Pittosporum tobira CRESS virus]|nr:Cap [Pittosporum tobira CRESS virus]
MAYMKRRNLWNPRRTWDSKRYRSTVGRKPYQRYPYSRKTSGPPRTLQPKSHQYVRLSASPLVIGWNGNTALLSAFVMGNGEGNRSSNKTHIYALTIRMVCEMNNSSMFPPQELICHHFLVYDKMPMVKPDQYPLAPVYDKMPMVQPDQYPLAPDIFEGISPYLYHVKHDQKHHRSSNKTHIYALTIRMVCEMNNSSMFPPQELICHHFLVYDKMPMVKPDQYPLAPDIFEGISPYLYHVKHDQKHRFKVLKKWRQKVYSTGHVTDTSEAVPSHCNDGKYFYMKNLKVYTNWKNSSGGGLADIESGALYYIGVTTSGTAGQGSERMKVNVYYDNTVYFRCL